MLITGKIISAEEGKNIGLVNELFEDKDSLSEGSNKWIEKYILPKSASSLRFGVKAVRGKLNHVLSNFLPQLEVVYVHQLMETHDANEGINSFLKKETLLDV